MLSPKVFLSLLIEKGYVQAEAAEKLELEALQSGKEIEEIVNSYNLAPRDVVLEAKAKCMSVPCIDIVGAAVNPQVLEFVTKTTALRYNIMPFGLDENSKTISIATADPLNLNLQNFIEQKTGYHVLFHLAYLEDIQKAISVAYNQTFAPDVSRAVKDTSELRSVNVPTAETTRQTKTVEDSPITKIVDTIMQYASQSRASDVHIEPQATQTRVRYRIDGILQEKLVLPISLHESLVSRLKIMAGLKLDERRIPQDGRFDFKSDITEVDVRVSTLPTVNGEKMVMRLLRKTGGLPTLTELGMQGSSLKLLEKAITNPHGIILVTGPTGSGKTTTLYSVLTILNTPTTNIVTLEDPVEYQISGINQVQVNNQAGLTFAAGLRSFLRQDPNIILVGEIRDTETTSLAVQAALTGHLVLSTLHTNDAATAIPRLIDLGAEPFLLTSSLLAIVGQRIARQVCKACQITYQPDESLLRDISQAVYGDEHTLDTRDVKLTKGAGCEQCNHTGYYGRIGIFEVLMVTPEINKLILRHASASDINIQATKEGMVSMRQDGYMKVLAGLTTPEEVMRLTQL